MKSILMLMAVLAAAFAWNNPATSDILGSEYGYVACNVQFAKDFVGLREECGIIHDVPVLDSSEYLEEIDEELVDAEDAAGDGNRLEYGGAVFALNLKMLGLGLAIIGDAFHNKTVAFNSCVTGGTAPLKEELEACRASAFEDGKAAAHAYLANDVERGESEVAELDAMGAETLGMENVLEYADGLDADIDEAYDSHEVSEVKKLYDRHSRIVLLFRLEKMISTIDYAEPAIEAGNNENKEELLEEMAGLEGDIAELAEDCAYSADVGSGYASENTRCWIEGLSMMQRFNALYTLYWAGV